VTFTADPSVVYHVDVAGSGGEEGSFYLRAYAGAGVARPAPDTALVRYVSLAEQVLTNGYSLGEVTGPRHSPSFAFTSPDAGAGFQCSLDGSAFAACASPASYDGLAPGSAHAFRVRAVVGGTPDPTPAGGNFTLDGTAPDTSIASGPSGDEPSQAVQWTAAATKRNNAGQGFQCRLDGQLAQPCSASASFGNLCQGPHTFATAAWDGAFNGDATPATRQINETSGPPCAAPTISVSAVHPVATHADLGFAFNDHGAGATIHLEYGPAVQYGQAMQDYRAPPSAGADSTGFDVRFLEPETLYHYRATITTPFGTADTGDQTFTTSAAGSALPVVETGVASATGHYAAHIPFTIDAGGTETFYGVLLSKDAQATQASSIFFVGDIQAADTGPQSRAFDVIDLDPGATYHYRVWTQDGSGVGHDSDTISPDRTFTVPPLSRAGTTAGPGPGPVARTPTPIVKPLARPAISGATQSHRVWRRGGRLARFTKRRAPVGTTFSFTLNTPAGVAFVFTQRVAGRRVGKRCVAPTRGNRRRAACGRTVVRGTLSFNRRAGRNRLAFQGRLSRTRRLAPGRYTVVITARNAFALPSVQRRLSFTIVS
jgi:hypothetical protein